MKLTNPTDAELNAAFAEKVAGWRYIPPKGQMPEMWNTGTDCIAQGAGFAWRVPRYSELTDSVIPWLEKQGWRGTSNRAGSTCAATVSVLDDVGNEFVAQQDYTHTQTPFPRAAVIALLRAYGVEVEITK